MLDWQAPVHPVPIAHMQANSLLRYRNSGLYQTRIVYCSSVSWDPSITFPLHAGSTLLTQSFVSIWKFYCFPKFSSNVVSSEKPALGLPDSSFFCCDLLPISSYLYWRTLCNILISMCVSSLPPPARCPVFVCIHSNAHYAQHTIGAH